jgi:hypothetical protein
MIRQVPQLQIRIPHQRDGLCDLLNLLAEHHINMLAYVSLWDADGQFAWIASDQASRAKSLVEASGYSATLDSVLLVAATDRVGALAELKTILKQAGVDVFYSYATYSGGLQFYSVFKTSDDQVALTALERSHLFFPLDHSQPFLRNLPQQYPRQQPEPRRQA